MTIRYRGGNIASFSPAIDARTDDTPRVIDGRNFKFDALGPKAGFGNRILTPFPLHGVTGVQGLRVYGHTFLLTQEAILEWRTRSPFTWDLLYAFPNVMQDPLYFPWYGFTIAGNIYLGHVSRGLYKAVAEGVTGNLEFKYVLDSDIPGLPTGILGATVVRNRAILVTKNQVYWSATGDLSSLAPTPGGAGFQLLTEFVQGEFIGISSFREGFIVWTDDGAVLAEYIDGDLVWRWSAYESQERPIGPWAITEVSNGMSVFLSGRGLKYTADGKTPQDWTPEFNEFFRPYVTQGSKRINARDWRLTYNMDTEEVYVSESADSATFWRTYVLHPTIDKWGVFSEQTHGLLPLTNDLFGYIDYHGIPRYFDGGFAMEEMPDASLGLNRTIPRVQKTSLPPSSTAVSRIRAYNPEQVIAVGQELEFSAQEVMSAGWHSSDDFGLATYKQGGLRSWIEIGYLRPPEMNESSDGSMEVHEIVVSTPDSSPVNPQPYQIVGYEELWDWGWEDWNSIPLIFRVDFAVDLMDFEGVYDLNSIFGPPIDQNDITYPVVMWPAGVEVEDWGSMPDSHEDWHGDTLNLPPFKLNLEIMFSMDGRTEQIRVPELARFGRKAQHFTTMTHGNLHRIRLAALAPLEYYHASYLELTEQYGGQFI